MTGGTCNLAVFTKQFEVRVLVMVKLCLVPARFRVTLFTFGALSATVDIFMFMAGYAGRFNFYLVGVLFMTLLAA